MAGVGRQLRLVEGVEGVAEARTPRSGVAKAELEVVRRSSQVREVRVWRWKAEVEVVAAGLSLRNRRRSGSRVMSRAVEAEEVRPPHHGWSREVVVEVGRQ